MYVELPAVTATPADRLQALRDARALLTTTPGETKPAFFGGGSVETVYAPDTAELLRLAEYITTGHDYRDTHPAGKRRPIINTTNVTVVAPPAVDNEDLEHFLHHVENGDFTEFLKEAMAQPVKDEDAESAGHDWTPAPEDEK